MTTPQPVDPAGAGGPTVLRILLGANLRQLRESRGISRQDAGWQIRASESKISRIELGRVGFKERDVADLLSLYGVDDPNERERLLALAREANNPGWWHRYSELLPTWFLPFIGLESAASLIRNYETQFVPGLLQTPDYARALVRSWYPRAGDEEIERRVEVRMTRQDALGRAQPLHLWGVMDEAALRRMVGGNDVMRKQIDRLLEWAAAPHVTIQVVPFGIGTHSAHVGAFQILRFADNDLPDVVYVEQMTSALYLDKREDVDVYTEVMETLCIQAATPEDTVDILHSIRSSL